MSASDCEHVLKHWRDLLGMRGALKVISSSREVGQYMVECAGIRKDQFWGVLFFLFLSFRSLSLVFLSSSLRTRKGLSLRRFDKCVLHTYFDMFIYHIAWHFCILTLVYSVLLFIWHITLFCISFAGLELIWMHFEQSL